MARGWQLTVTASNVTCCAGAVLPAPFIQSLTISNSVDTVTWSAVPYQNYRLQSATNLDCTNWIDVPPDVLATNFSARASTASNSTSRIFYRVKALGP